MVTDSVILPKASLTQFSEQCARLFRRFRGPNGLEPTAIAIIGPCPGMHGKESPRTITSDQHALLAEKWVDASWDVFDMVRLCRRIERYARRFSPAAHWKYRYISRVWVFGETNGLHMRVRNLYRACRKFQKKYEMIDWRKRAEPMVFTARQLQSFRRLLNDAIYAFQKLSELQMCMYPVASELEAE